MIKIATVCSGIGSPEQALKNMGIPHEISFACEIDKYARQTYQANFTPAMMLTDMTKETWVGPEFYSDLFIGGIPCQAFSLAGKRLGELDPRGLLFYDFYRYVKIQQPKVFIIENVKGLLSDNNGTTFRNWLQLLGQSENTHYNMFNHPDSLMYNLHYKVLNSKDFGVPQNRERVFLVGIREDLPNLFRFPSGKRLTKRLKDILESEVDERYYLTDKYIKSIVSHSERHQAKGNGFEFKPTTGEGIATTITTKAGKITTDNYVLVSKERRSEESKAERRKNGSNAFRGKDLFFENQEYMNCIQTAPTNDNLILIGGINNRELILGGETKDYSQGARIYNENGISCTLSAQGGGMGAKTGLYAIPNFTSIDLDGNVKNLPVGYSVRRLTPLECMRLQGFPDGYLKPCSDTQTYKQAGNSITVNVMQAIINRLIEVLQGKIAA